MARGQLVTKQQITGSTADEDAKNAIVVGGAELLQSRTIGLAVADEFAHAVTMNAVVPVINKRFTVFDGSGNVGAAKINNVNYIELNVPPQYRLDPDHFANVVQHLGVAETAADKQARLERCKLQLLDSITARKAAWQLEAVGKDAIPMLLDGLYHPDKEVRFYAAHALAYLDDGRAIPVLQELATIEPAFRAMCLNAISLVRNYKAGDALEQLLSAPDPETRYGAVLAMREYDNRSPLVVGEKMGEVGSVLEVPSTGPNLVAVGLSTIPEVVIFGQNPPVNIDAFMYVNPRLMIRGQGIGRVSISHIVPGRDDRTAESTADLKSILRGISEVGGGFGDWVNFVRLCGADKLIPAEVAMNPVPLSGRKYNRDGLTLGTENSEVPPAAPPAETLPVPKGDEPSGSVQWLNPMNWFGKK
ncbi:MAG: HEAT repeat domain-containing protein [Pirellulaceae bacterium]|nr:HEAT repeat domain-containing protein [Pirellulaceae bacterium]